MLSIRDTLEIVRHLGAGWLVRRALYAARRRLGGLERAMPRCAWSEIEAPGLALARPSAGRGQGGSVNAAAVARGEFTLFSHRRVVAGCPPDWHRNQLTGESVPADVHWSRVGDFRYGDIKGVWELSRFGWAYELVRDGGPDSAEVFWRLWENWMERNPPNSGPNWMCGQEASIRLMAVIFAAERFGVPERHRLGLSRFVVATAQRVAANLDYALEQQNNHGVSECVGLLACALLLPTHPAAAAWRRRAMERLREQVEELVYPDGAFSQHSLVYHRVALHLLCWAITRIRGTGEPEPEWLLAAGRRATDFLAALTDPKSGEAPLYGANDGANLLPLTHAEFLDQRPAVQLGSALFHRQLRYAPGPWDEAVAWLDPESLNLPRHEAVLRDFRAPHGGVLQLATGADRLVMRCPTGFRHRPSHGDFGHVDIWLGGKPVAVDGGSFSYNSTERFVRLGDAREHNSVSVPGLEPMRKVTRFLQLPWPTAELREHAAGEWTYRPRLFAATGVEWTRSIARRSQGGFRVHDIVTGAVGRQLRWHWRLVAADWTGVGENGLQADMGAEAVQLEWHGPAGLRREVLRADATSASGWQSRHYGEVEPAVSLVLTAAGADRVEMMFEFSCSS